MENSEALVQQWRDRNSEEVSKLKAGFDKMVENHQKDSLDKIAKTAHQNTIEKIDCLDCGNCCRTSVTDFSKSDIKRVAKHLGMPPKSFIKKYLIEDLDGTYVTITSPCPFLELSTNKCSIYEVRPTVCSSYPHTQREGFSRRKKAHKANLDMCPITYHMVKKMLDQI